MTTDYETALFAIIKHFEHGINPGDCFPSQYAAYAVAEGLDPADFLQWADTVPVDAPDPAEHNGQVFAVSRAFRKWAGLAGYELRMHFYRTDGDWARWSVHLPDFDGGFLDAPAAFYELHAEDEEIWITRAGDAHAWRVLCATIGERDADASEHELTPFYAAMVGKGDNLDGGDLGQAEILPTCTGPASEHAGFVVEGDCEHCCAIAGELSDDDTDRSRPVETYMDAHEAGLAALHLDGPVTGGGKGEDFVVECSCGESFTGMDPDDASAAHGDHVDGVEWTVRGSAARRAIGGLRDTALEESIGDAIADLLHLAAVLGEHPLDFLIDARKHFDEEN